MSHGGLEGYAEKKAVKKRIQENTVTNKENTHKARSTFVIDEENVLDLTEFEAVLYSFKEISSYKLQLTGYQLLILQIAVTAGHRFDDFDQSLALRVGQYFKCKSISGLRLLIQEV